MIRFVSQNWNGAFSVARGVQQKGRFECAKEGESI
jgi:hypothetical protein